MLPVGTRVKFNIDHGLDVGIAKIIAIDTEEEDNKTYLYYELEVISCSRANMHRNDQGRLWVNDFEVKPTGK